MRPEYSVNSPFEPVLDISPHKTSMPDLHHQSFRVTLPQYITGVITLLACPPPLQETRQQWRQHRRATQPQPSWSSRRSSSRSGRTQSLPSSATQENQYVHGDTANQAALTTSSSPGSTAFQSDPRWRWSTSRYTFIMPFPWRLSTKSSTWSHASPGSTEWRKEVGFPRTLGRSHASPAGIKQP